MRLSDHLLAARGTITDLFGFATSMSRSIAEAQRFEIADEVAVACSELMASRPSSLAAALPLCRLPYKTMWLEWNGGLGKDQQIKRANAPVPDRQGVLIESLDGQIGFMTIAWVHDTPDVQGVNISPISVYFDWRPDGNVIDIVKTAHRTIIKPLPVVEQALLAPFMVAIEKKWAKISTREIVSHFFTGTSKWKQFVNDAREIEAIREMDRHMLPGVSMHGTGMIASIFAAGMRGNQDQMMDMVHSWEADMQGEASFVECFLAMLNSKNPVVEHEPVNLTKLNKARARRGKPKFLEYSKTRLTMSRSQKRRADAQGVDRETARQHLVMGHFKIRKSGVYWWSSFLRGDARKGTIKRQQYDVVD
jgi:hypothetical protein